MNYNFQFIIVTLFILTAKKSHSTNVSYVFFLYLHMATAAFCELGYTSWLNGISFMDKG